MTGFFHRRRQEIRQGEGSEAGNQPLGRSGSRESLERHREGGRRSGERQRISNAIDREQIESLPNYQEAQSGDLAFPKLSLWDEKTHKPVNLLETHIMDTKNFISTQENTKQTFETLYERARVIKYYVREHKGFFNDIDIPEEEYSNKAKILKKSRMKVTVLFMQLQHPSHININLPSPGEIASAIGVYKLALKDVLDVAHKLHRVANGLPPLAETPVQGLPHGPALSDEEINRGAQRLQLLRVEAERRQQQQEQQLSQQQQEERRRELEFREEIERSNNTDQ